MNRRKVTRDEILTLAIGVFGIIEIIVGSIIYSGLLIILGLMFTYLAILNLPHEYDSDDHQIERE